MKTIFRFAGSGMLLAAVIALGSMVTFAQDAAATPSPACADVDGQTAVYTKFTGIYNKKDVAEMKNALATGKEFLEKYGACETLKEQTDFVKPHVARLEKAIPAAEKQATFGPLFTRFDAGIGTETGPNAKSPDEVYAAGKEILAKQPENAIHFMIPLALAGHYEMYFKNNPKYANDALQYSQTALSQIKSGQAQPRKDEKNGKELYGFLKYSLSKDDAISELTYAVGHLTYYAKKDKKAALPYFYELSQGSGVFKSEPRVYTTIGSFYVDEAAPLGTEIAELIKKQQDPAGTPEEKEAREKVIKEKVALFNGYAERALDAFGRAHAFAKSDTPENKKFKDGLYQQLQTLYNSRFGKKDGLDTYIAAAVTKPMPNPTSPVTPVADPEPATTTTTTGTTAPAPAAAAKTAVNGSKTPVPPKPKPRR